MTTLPISKPKPTSLWLNAFSLFRMGAAIISGAAVTLGYVDPKVLPFDANAGTLGGELVIIGLGAWHVVKNYRVTQRLVDALQSPAVRLND